VIQYSEAEAKHRLREVLKCRKSFVYFCDTYCQILADSGQGGEWVPFRLWPEQRRVARLLQDNRLVVVLKARQLGLTWLLVAFALWLMLFHPIATVLLFSRRDDEAVDLLTIRLRGMHDRLPDWLRASGFTTANDHELALTSESRAMAFPTTAGDSYTATLAIVDEADLCLDLERLMRAVKPTIDGGGRMVLLSRADKSRPLSPFKKIYTAARQGQNTWASVFLPWHARPGRDAAWYEGQRRDIVARTGALDDLHEQYPATDAEALSPRSLDKRIAPAWLLQCFREVAPIEADGAPAIPGLIVFAAPVPGHKYVIGGDPAEGNPTSDDSALCVMDAASGEQVAELAGKYEPAVLASYAYTIALWYNAAGTLFERNNHGHACLLWFREHGRGVKLLKGRDGKDGWLSSTLGKTELYDRCADALKNSETTIRSFATFTQLSSIDGQTLRAPEGQPDDRADAFALAVCARSAGGLPVLIHVVSAEAEAEVQKEWLAERQEAQGNDLVREILRDLDGFPGAWREFLTAEVRCDASGQEETDPSCKSL
jgi:hypothetical protein